MKNLLCILVTICLISCNEKPDNKIDLSGEWAFQIDTAEVGITERWYTRPLAEIVSLPGSMNTNGKGFKVDVNTPWVGSMWNKKWYEDDSYAKYRTDDSTKIVFWLQPDKYYTGVAWYQKKIKIPEEWRNKTIRLFLERCHWVTEAWVGSKSLGSSNSLSTPHCYLIKDIEPGDHLLTLRIDNKIREINLGSDAHSVSDNTQSNWNGAIGRLELEVLPSIFIENTRIEPLLDKKQTSVQVTIHNTTPSAQNVKLNIEGKSLDIASRDVTVSPGKNVVNVELDWRETLKKWDEFTPNLYTLTTAITFEKETHKRQDTYGLRNWETKDSRLFINGRQAFIRGTLECCIFPKTGFPPTDQAEWERIMKTCKDYGLNHIRFHSWCPPQAAFEVADRLGVYLQVESNAWAEVGSNKPVDAFIREESERIVAEYGNHPSFCFLASGNEPAGGNQMEFVSGFVDMWKNRDRRFLVTTSAGWPAYQGSDYHSLPHARIQAWGEGTRSLINSQTPRSDYDWSSRIAQDKPTISHEIGQWCAYPNLKERAKYTGAFKARNFDIYEDRLRESNLLHLADSFLLASGKLQALCYKADIEAALRTEGFAGFQLLDLHDFPGQGTALVGVLDAFWENKGYISAEQYREFCNEVVPLFRTPRFIYNDGEILDGSIEIAQYSREDLSNCVVRWSLSDVATGAQIKSEQLKVDKISTGSLAKVGKLNMVLSTKTPKQYELLITVNDKYKNRWNIWVYPQEKPKVPQSIKISSALDKETIQALAEGKNILLSPSYGTLKNQGKDSVAVGFSSIFWNTLWTNNQAPHTLGILCNPQHPALRLFPTDFHSNYQWMDAMSHCNAIPLRKLGKDIQPIVRIIDDWFTARSFGMIVELKVGKGKLLLCSADLLTDMDKRPSAKQLYVSLINYMESMSFNPVQTTSIEQLKDLFKK